jgi:hypothetical protein
MFNIVIVIKCVNLLYIQDTKDIKKGKAFPLQAYGAQRVLGG